MQVRTSNNITLMERLKHIQRITCIFFNVHYIWQVAITITGPQSGPQIKGIFQRVNLLE